MLLKSIPTQTHEYSRLQTPRKLFASSKLVTGDRRFGLLRKNTRRLQRTFIRERS